MIAKDVDVETTMTTTMRSCPLFAG